jgi:tetratricopeptide (TPR) repeat protein
MKVKLALCVTAFLTFSFAAYGQAKGGSTTSGSTTPPPNPSAGPASTSDIGKYANWDRLSKDARPGDYLRGLVSVQGGALPWEPIPVNVTCDEKPRYTTRTDVKGNFLITSTSITGSTPVKPDAQRAMVAQFIGCQVRAALPGFQSSTITIPNRDIKDNADIGTISLRQEEGAQGGAMSNTSQSAPKDAVKSYDKARSEWLDQKPDKAQKDLERAVQVYPQYAEAWYQLGKLQEKSNPQDARNSYLKAVAADPKFILPYQHLATLAAMEGKWQDLLDYTNHMLQIEAGGTPQVWYYSALANTNLKNDKVAEASARKGLAMDPLHTEPNTEQLLAVILAA